MIKSTRPPCPTLPAESVEFMWGPYRSTTGGDPPEYECPSADQLSGLVFMLESGMAPYAGFAVFGPYGRRQAKLLRYTAHGCVDAQLVTR